MAQITTSSGRRSGRGSDTAQYFAFVDDGARLFLRVTPGAAKNEIAGLWQGADGERRLAVRITAPPDRGRANAAVLKLLAKALGLPKSSLSITAGETSRLKTVAISGAPDALAAALKGLTGETT